ncbi:hemerythrin domain-containing protein [Achromobacter aegrifaciens]
MNCNTEAQYSPSSGTDTAPRMDIYVGIHKALRAMMLDTLQAVGRVDAHDVAATQTACERVQELADICASHLGHENDFIHTAMEARRPGSSGRIAGEHVEHIAEIEQLRHAVSTLCAANCGATRTAAALLLYRQLALFVGENFAHMHIEETQHNQVLWSCYSDEELRALEGAIVASLPPAENLCILRWMIPAMTPAERAKLLAGVQAAAPAPVFATVLDTVRPHLGQQDWARLTGALAPAEPPVRIVA